MSVRLGKETAKLVSGHAPVKVNPNGVDIGVSEVWFIDLESEATINGKERRVTPDKVKIEPAADGFYYLKRGVYEVRLANEIEIPANATGFVHPRSTLNRMGIISSPTAVWDSGYKGFGTITFHVPLRQLKIHKNELWVQLVIVDNKDAVQAGELYQGHWQGEKPKTRAENP